MNTPALDALRAKTAMPFARHPGTGDVEFLERVSHGQPLILPRRMRTPGELVEAKGTERRSDAVGLMGPHSAPSAGFQLVHPRDVRALALPNPSARPNI